MRILDATLGAGKAAALFLGPDLVVIQIPGRLVVPKPRYRLDSCDLQPWRCSFHHSAKRGDEPARRLCPASPRRGRARSPAAPTGPSVPPGVARTGRGGRETRGRRTTRDRPAGQFASPSVPWHKPACHRLVNRARHRSARPTRRPGCDAPLILPYYFSGKCGSIFGRQRMIRNEMRLMRTHARKLLINRTRRTVTDRMRKLMRMMRTQVRN
jgi:hypothetical protein